MQRSIQFSVAADCVARVGMTLEWPIGLSRKFFSGRLFGKTQPPDPNIAREDLRMEAICDYQCNPLLVH
jgi:hypothetical protein